ncbi:hypothetical protein [Oleiharenicola lentus]|uniref:hypothetical protein n=1 Tax=Oleiharenicola lentus TaxID=2508720 RepID=UPI003F6710BB
MNTPIRDFIRVSAAACALLVTSYLRAEAPAELTEAVTRWAGERDRWAFTQTVKEFDGEQVEQERRETYDPSRPIEKRWELVNIDGRSPTADERAVWDKRKNKKRKRDPKPLVEYFDFENAKVQQEDAQTVRYQVPLKGGANWLFSVEKVQLAIAINKSARAVERVDATISEPFKVALGLARILDFNMELHMQPTGGGESAEPAASSPNGTMHAVVNKFGQRVEYRWSDFKRVTPHPDWAKAAAAVR